MDDEKLDRFNIKRAQTVTLVDGTEVRFRWVEFAILEEWMELRESQSTDSEYVVLLLSILSYDRDETLQKLRSWPAARILELVEKFIVKFGDKDQMAVIESFAQARAGMDDFLRQRERGLNETAQRGIERLNKWFGQTAMLPQLDGGILLGDSFRNLAEQIQLSQIETIGKMQEGMETISRGISTSLMQYSSLSEKITKNMILALDWSSAFQINVQNLSSIFQSTFSWDIPSYLEDAHAQHRADFLLEEKLHFLLDAADIGIEDFTKELHRRSIDSRPAEITKYLHQATSDDDFVEDLLIAIDSIAKIRGRKRAIEAAILAHSGRNYLLSIPALLPQVEALTMQLLANAHYVKWDRTKGKWYETVPETGKYRPNKSKGRVQVNGLGSLDGIVNRMIDSPMPHGLPLLHSEVARYRNLVLHGNMVRYDRPRESSRLVLLVMILVKIHVTTDLD